MFHFGLLTAILDGWTFEEAVDIAAEMGFECLEVACWPAGKADRRYAGVSHIDAERVLVDDAYAEHIKAYVSSKGIHISSLAYYPNVLDPDTEKSSAAISHLKALIQASAKLGVHMVTTFIGKDQHKSVEENIALFQQVWPSLIAFAQEQGVKIAIENCPMLFGAEQWPGGQNLMSNPVVYQKLFELIPSPNFGLNYDPSHHVWQQMDYIQPIYDFKDRIFHIHLKDTKLHHEKLKRCGIFAYPLEYMTPKIPGYGDIDWEAFVKALNDIGFTGNAVIEVEDAEYEDSRARVLESIRLSGQYLRRYI